MKTASERAMEARAACDAMDGTAGRDMVSGAACDGLVDFMARLGKRNRKFLGTRNHGKGNAKNRRGKGGKGGWGRAGTGKHRWTYITAHEPEFAAKGGHWGFSNPNARKVKALNLFEIQNMANAGKIPSKDGKMTLEFDGKILGGGEISAAVAVRAQAASKKAMERIKAAGGSFEQIGDGNYSGGQN